MEKWHLDCCDHSDSPEVVYTPFSYIVGKRGIFHPFPLLDSFKVRSKYIWNKNFKLAKDVLKICFQFYYLFNTSEQDKFTPSTTVIVTTVNSYSYWKIVKLSAGQSLHESIFFTPSLCDFNYCKPPYLPQLKLRQVKNKTSSNHERGICYFFFCCCCCCICSFLLLPI